MFDFDRISASIKTGGVIWEWEFHPIDGLFTHDQACAPSSLLNGIVQVDVQYPSQKPENGFHTVRWSTIQDPANAT